MITMPGYAKDVFEITDTDVTIPVREEVPPTVPGKRVSYRYTAPSTSVLAVSKFDSIELIVGRNVSEQVLKNVLGFGIKSKKTLKISRCEVLGNLREVDRMVTLCNDVIKSQRGVLEDFLTAGQDADDE